MAAFRAITAAASGARSGRLSGSIASAAAAAVSRQDVNIPSSGLPVISPVVSPVSKCFYAKKNRCPLTIPAADLVSPAIKPVVRRLYGRYNFRSVIGLPPVANFKAVIPVGRSTRLFTTKSEISDVPPPPFDGDTSDVPPPSVDGDNSDVPPPPVDGDTSDVPPPPVDGDNSDVPPPTVDDDITETPLKDSVSAWRKIVRYGSENFGDMSYWTTREGFFLMTFSLFMVSQISGVLSHSAMMTALEHGFSLASTKSTDLFEAVKTGFEEALKGSDSTTLSDDEVKAIAETVADAVAKKIDGSRGWWRFW